MMTDQAKRLMDASYSRVVAEVRALRQERDEALMLAAHPDISTLKDLAREVVYRWQRMLDLEAALAAFAPYLKDGETPIERLERERHDNDILMGLLAKEKAHVEMVVRVESQRLMARDKEIADLQIERSLADKATAAARSDRDRFQCERDEARDLLRDCRAIFMDVLKDTSGTPNWDTLVGFVARLDAVLGGAK